MASTNSSPEKTTTIRVRGWCGVRNPETGGICWVVLDRPVGEVASELRETTFLEHEGPHVDENGLEW